MKCEVVRNGCGVRMPSHRVFMLQMESCKGCGRKVRCAMDNTKIQVRTLSYKFEAKVVMYSLIYLKGGCVNETRATVSFVVFITNETIDVERRNNNVCI